VITVYILRCSDRSYYVGSTTNLEARLQEHQNGKGGSFTSRRRPIELVYSERFLDRQHAIEREQQLKGWTVRKKEALIRGDLKTLKRLSTRRRWRARDPASSE
jgi:predicted GIY-YIG superfamily endonuclease